MIDMTPELERKNLVLGWALFAISLLLFAGTFAHRASLPGPRLTIFLAQPEVAAAR